MSSTLRLTALVWQEGDEFVSLCPEVDVASFGTTIDEALAMLREALGAFFADAPVPDLPPHGEPLVTTISVDVPGTAAGAPNAPAARVEAVPVGTPEQR
jgi:predicted RNase H-like HicB family nuclease